MSNAWWLNAWYKLIKHMILCLFLLTLDTWRGGATACLIRITPLIGTQWSYISASACLYLFFAKPNLIGNTDLLIILGNYFLWYVKQRFYIHLSSIWNVLSLYRILGSARYLQLLQNIQIPWRNDQGSCTNFYWLFYIYYTNLYKHPEELNIMYICTV